MFEASYSLLKVIESLGSVYGRKKLQKIVHLLEATGSDLSFTYQYHHYGPYSTELQQEVNFLVQQNLLEERQVDGAYVYEITEAGTAFRRTLDESGEREVRIDEQLLHTLAEENSQFLEVVSTYVFLLESGLDAERAKAKALELKPHLVQYLEPAVDFTSTTLRLN